MQKDSVDSMQKSLNDKVTRSDFSVNSKSLAVGINAFYVRWGENGGTETYLTNIVLPWYKENSTRYTFTLFCNSLPPWWEGEKTYFKIRLFPSTSSVINRILVEQLILPWISRSFDVSFNPGYVVSLFSPSPQVVTIHDAFAWRAKDEISFFKEIYWKIFIPLSLKRSRKIIFVSQSTASDLQELCYFDENKIRVIKEAGFSDNQDLAVKESVILRLERKFKFKRSKYFHCVGIFKSIKNPNRIIEAFNKFKISVDDPEMKLLLCGFKSKDFSSYIDPIIEKNENIISMARLDSDELIEIYRNSRGLIFCSLYEGFGIPILEAQKLECPVITSNMSSMPEVAGKGALLVDPFSIGEIKSAMQEIYYDADHFVSEGIINVDRFNWIDVSTKTLSAIIEQ